jgi:hypothetical protein
MNGSLRQIKEISCMSSNVKELKAELVIIGGGGAGLAAAVAAAVFASKT